MSNHTQREELRAGLMTLPLDTPIEDVDGLMMPLIDQYTQRLVLEGKIELLTEQITGYERALAKADEETRFIFQPIIESVRKSRAELQSQLDKLNGDRES